MAEGKNKSAPVWPVLVLLGLGGLALVWRLVPKVVVDADVRLALLVGLVAVGVILNVAFIGVVIGQQAREKKRLETRSKIAAWVKSRNE